MRVGVVAVDVGHLIGSEFGQVGCIVVVGGQGWIVAIVPNRPLVAQSGRYAHLCQHLPQGFVTAVFQGNPLALLWPTPMTKWTGHLKPLMAAEVVCGWGVVCGLQVACWWV